MNEQTRTYIVATLIFALLAGFMIYNSKQTDKLVDDYTTVCSEYTGDCWLINKGEDQGDIELGA
jgi:hypothetical protein